LRPPNTLDIADGSPRKRLENLFEGLLPCVCGPTRSARSLKLVFISQLCSASEPFARRFPRREESQVLGGVAWLTWREHDFASRPGRCQGRIAKVELTLGLNNSTRARGLTWSHVAKAAANANLAA